MIPTPSLITGSTRTAIHLTCPAGLAHSLRDEVTALGYTIESFIANGVTIAGTFTDAMRCCLHLRCAHHVLFRLARFDCLTPQELYEHAAAIAWESILHEDGYLSISSTVLTDAIRDTRFANLTLKDAIVDRMRLKCGKRPDSGSDKTRAVVHLYWKESRGAIYYDCAGEPLCRRGYRTNPYRAPLQESLAAAMIYASGWRGEDNFLNPMCGSGTLAVEAAHIGLRIAPGLARSNFSFMHSKLFDKNSWQSLRNDAAALRLPALKGSIVASDHNPRAIEIARENAAQAGVENYIEWQTADFAQSRVPEGRGVVIINPEYGERLGDLEALKTTYSNMGNFLKRQCAGYTGFILTSNAALAARVGLKSKRKIPFNNGSIECKMYEYELF